jgi:putative transposase
VKVRQSGRIVSVATIIAVAVNSEGRREVLGMATGPSEAEPFWTQFLRSLTRRGLRGVKLVISDAHEGLKAAVAKVLKASWQRCRVHFLRNALAYANKGQRQMVFALINTIFAQESAEAAHGQWRIVVDQLRAKLPKLAAMMDEAEHEVLTFMDFPKDHRVKIHSTNEIDKGVVRDTMSPARVAAGQRTACRLQAPSRSQIIQFASVLRHPCPSTWVGRASG